MKIRVTATVTAELSENDRLDLARRFDPNALEPAPPELATLAFSEMLTERFNALSYVNGGPIKLDVCVEA